MKTLIWIASNICVAIGYCTAGAMLQSGLKLWAVIMLALTTYILWFVQYAVKGRGGHEE